MTENSKIEWTDHTFNPWIGCTRVSPGCQHCYAEATARTYKMVEWGVNASRRHTSADYWRAPIRWNAKAGKLGRRYSVFCASMADVFDDHPSILPEWRGDLWKLIADTPNLDWLLLTKRPENWAKFLPARSPGSKWAHVRVGCTIEDQRRFDERAPHLIREHGNGWLTFVSYEPAIGPVDFAPAIHAIGWLIAGDESGHGARPSDDNWYRDARDVCRAAGVPFFLKQKVQGSRKISLPMLDGQQWAQFPQQPASPPVAHPRDHAAAPGGDPTLPPGKFSDRSEG